MQDQTGLTRHVENRVASACYTGRRDYIVTVSLLAREPPLNHVPRGGGPDLQSVRVFCRHDKVLCRPCKVSVLGRTAGVQVVTARTPAGTLGPVGVLALAGPAVPAPHGVRSVKAVVLVVPCPAIPSGRRGLVARGTKVD